ncbi:phospholipase A [Campylobacter mucosalis]|uniref:phospholipase A n=1 Tax=Campylobacter mucosalis TaxID=202 RepID=UPI003211BCA8
MKIFKILVLFATLLISSDEFYSKALEFEKRGDIQNAMKFYKLAYESKTAKVVQVSPQKPQTTDTFWDIKTYDLNYLMPVAYTKNIADDRQKKVETKFQFSVQKPIFYDILGLKELVSVAYSQTSWWQTAKSSTPFRESNYRPEIFVQIPTKYDTLKWVKFGFLHESNGKSGENSRSWNRVYLSSSLGFGGFVIEPRIWTSVGDLDDNKDIKKYIGNADLKVGYKLGLHTLSAKFSSNLHLDNTNRTSAQLDWIFPLFSDMYGYISYFNGYGDSLIDYNRHTNRIGIGFAILN